MGPAMKKRAVFTLICSKWINGTSRLEKWSGCKVAIPFLNKMRKREMVYLAHKSVISFKRIYEKWCVWPIILLFHSNGFMKFT